jgi:hypothetical protein
MTANGASADTTREIKSSMHIRIIKQLKKIKKNKVNAE